jgi:hypothetical protein
MLKKILMKNKTKVFLRKKKKYQMNGANLFEGCSGPYLLANITQSSITLKVKGLNPAAVVES